MTDNKTIKDIAKNIKNSEYDFIGIRVEEEINQSIGQIVTHKSYVWDDGVQTDELINGVCAIDITQVKYLDNFGGYFGKIVYILGSYSAEYGNDCGEIIMRDAVVLDIIDNR